jgi:hypothetical protein
MTGNQLAKQLKTVKGKVYAYVSTADDGMYIPVEKTSLSDWLTGCADSETGMRISINLGIAYFEKDNS